MKEILQETQIESNERGCEKSFRFFTVLSLLVRGLGWRAEMGLNQHNGELNGEFLQRGGFEAHLQKTEG